MNIIHLICSQDIHNRQETNLLISRIMYMLLGNIFPFWQERLFHIKQMFSPPP